MSVCILSANLGAFDTPVDPVEQNVPVTFHRWTDENFPPITGLTPRLQYRIPKTHGWEMYPGYDYYVWLDGSMTLSQSDSVAWLLEQLGDNDMAFFKHPWRKTMQEEIAHIEDHLNRGKDYITSRYKNGLHREQPQDAYTYPLLASMVFIYRNNGRSRQALKDWWYYGSRYFTCDQVNLSWCLRDLNLKVIDEDVFKNQYVTLASKHS